MGNGLRALGALLLLSGLAGALGLSFPRGGEVERGRYLVDEVARCSECHTPRTADGELDAERYLQGAPIWIEPVHPDPHWAIRVPGIAGLGAYSEENMEAVLERGVGANGMAIQPPMHAYHMDGADARAIIAYLKSLPVPPR
jgi:mono/diheme cytochrome c family protein